MRARKVRKRPNDSFEARPSGNGHGVATCTVKSYLPVRCAALCNPGHGLAVFLGN